MRQATLKFLIHWNSRNSKMMEKYVRKNNQKTNSCFRPTSEPAGVKALFIYASFTPIPPHHLPEEHDLQTSSIGWEGCYDTAHVSSDLIFTRHNSKIFTIQVTCKFMALPSLQNLSTIVEIRCDYSRCKRKGYYSRKCFAHH